MSRSLRVERMSSGIYFTPSNSSGGFDAQDASRHPSTEAFYTLPSFPGTQRSYASNFTALLRPSHYEPITPSVSPFPPSPAPATPRTPSLCLPLLKIRVEVTIDDFIASTTLTQHFINRSETVIPQAHYTFPLYDGAVVTAFKCSVGDDKVLIGKVKPKDEARATFKAAVEEKFAAALLEEQTPEIFETVVGNIPPMTEVEVEIKYASELKHILLDGMKEGLEFVLPMSIAPRYGALPSQDRNVFNTLSDQPEKCGLDILVKICKDDSIESVEQSHHSNIRWNVPVEDNFAETFGAPAVSRRNLKDTQELSQIHIRHTDPTSIMNEDFVVTIETSQAHPLRSRAVLSPTNSTGHAALLVNVKPGELFQNVTKAETFDGEVIFVLDQSNSMEWPEYSRNGRPVRTKIETLRNAMPIVLSSLPSKCAFNILSFGSASRFLWESGSQKYTDSSRRAAIEYGKTVEANMGGTELLAAVQKAVDSRLNGCSSTQIIIITDGEVEEDSVLDYIWKTRQELGHQIRFFALGIGTRVPHRLIGRIGEFGGGYGEVIDIEAHPQWSDRLMHMLHAGLMPSSWDFEFDLGQEFERKSLVECRIENHESPQATNELVPFIQAPYPTPAMHPFSYRSIFFLLDLGQRHPPSHVTLRSITPKTNTQELRKLSVKPIWTNKSTMLHLATKSVLMGLDTLTREPGSDRTMLEIARSNAEYLGALYSVTSRWTSFVAFDQVRKFVSEVEFHKARLFKVSFMDALRPPMPKYDTYGSEFPNTGSGSLSTYPLAMEFAPSGFNMIARSTHAVRLGLSRALSRDISHMTRASCKSPEANDPFAKLATFQNAEGIFNPSERLRRALGTHFCPKTLDFLTVTLNEEIPSAHKLRYKDQYHIICTMMIVQYLQTHHSQDRQVWDMMASKAKHAVSQTLAIIGSEHMLWNIENALGCSAMHSHLKPESFVGDGKPPIIGCLICGSGKVSSTSKVGFTEREERSAVFSCTYAYCGSLEHIYVSWEDLWAHQTECGHLKCLRLEIALEDEDDEEDDEEDES